MIVLHTACFHLLLLFLWLWKLSHRVTTKFSVLATCTAPAGSRQSHTELPCGERGWQWRICEWLHLGPFPHMTGSIYWFYLLDCIHKGLLFCLNNFLTQLFLFVSISKASVHLPCSWERSECPLVKAEGIIILRAWMSNHSLHKWERSF